MMNEIESEHLDSTSEISLDVVKKRAVHGVVALTGRMLILQVLSLAATFFLGIFLTPGQFGIFFVVSAAVNIFQYFSDIGLAAAIIQKKETLSRQELETTFTVQNGMVVLLVVIIFLATPIFRTFYHLDQAAIHLLWALGLSLLMASLKSIPSALLERELKFNKLIIPQIVETIIYQFVVVVLAWKGFGVTSFTIAVLLRGISGLTLMYLIRPWKPGISFAVASLKNLMRFGIPYQVNTLIALFKDDGMTLVLGILIGTDKMGLLGWAQKWATAPLRFFMDQVIKVTFPAYSRMQDQPEHLSKAVTKSIFFICLLVFPALIGLVLTAPVLVQIIPKYLKWQPALIALGLITINSAWAAVTTPLTNLLNAVGKIKITFRLMLMWTFLTILFVPTLAYLHGINGAALGYAIVGTSSIIAILAVVKFVRIDFFSCVGKPLLAGMVMSVGLLLGRQILPVSWVGLMLLIVIGFISYSTALLLLAGGGLLADLNRVWQLTIVRSKVNESS